MIKFEVYKKVGYYYGDLCGGLVIVVYKFIEQYGLDGFLMFDVCCFVGVSIVVFYWYFFFKQDLIIEVIKDGFVWFGVDMEQWVLKQECGIV